MKKLLTLVALIAFAGSTMAATSFTTKLNNGINTLSQKEQNLNNKIDKAQAERAAKRAEAQKKAEADKKALEAKKAAIKKQQEANKKAVEAKKQEVKTTKTNAKNAIENEKSFWKSVFKSNN